MRGKSIFWTLAVLFVLQSDMASSTRFDFRFSLLKNEIHLEIGEVEAFEPYAYILQNRHVLDDGYSEHFLVSGEVDVTKMGEYEITYGNKMSMRVIVEDTTPPKLSLNALHLKQNDSFVWNEDTKAQVVADLQDNETEAQVLRENLQCEDIDTSVTGTRDVLCQVNDSSGNVTSKALAVTIQAPAGNSAVPASIPVTKGYSIPSIYYGGFETTQIREVANEVNRYRKENGLSPVALDLGLYHNVTYLRAQEVASKFSHTRPNGKACHTIYSDYGLGYGSEGENIARGQTSAKEVVSDWMNSPSHRANILRPEFTRMSVGLVNSGGVWVWVQEFFS